MGDALPRVGSALIVRDEANRILLGKRSKDPQRGSWILPGGKIHAFETIAQAAARELAEETGLDVEIEGQFQVYEIVEPPNEHRIIIYSWAHVRGGSLKPGDDVAEVRFVSLKELGGMPLTPLVRRVLQDAGYLPGDSLTTNQRMPTDAEVLFPVPIAGAATRHTRRSRRKTILKTAHGAIVSCQASLSFEG